MGDTVSLAVEVMDRNASKTLDGIGASFDDLGKAGERAAKDLGRLSERLTDLDEASVGKAAIDELGRSLDAGKITAEQYAEAVEEIQVASGLASDASVSAAIDLQNLNKSFESGEITASQYAEGLQEISSRSEDYADSAGDVKDSNEGAVGSFTELNSALELAGKGVELFKQAFEFGKEGAAIQRIGEQFQATTAQFGISGDALIAELDKVAGRTVDDEELMKVATRALTQDLVSSSDELVELFKVARASAVRFGGDTAEAFEQISLATETGMVRSLKARGIVLDLEQVYDDYAKLLGKTAKELTPVEEKQARLNAVLEQGAKLVESVGDSVDDNLSKFQRFERQVGDLGDDLKTLAVDALLPVLDAFELSRVAFDEATPASERLTAATELQSRSFGLQKIQLDKLVDTLRPLAQEEERHKSIMEDLTSVEEDRTVGLRHMAETQAIVADREKAMADALDKSRRILAGSIGLAIEYTKSNEELAGIQAELVALDEKIAERGARRVIIQQASVETTQEFAEAQLRLAVAQEHLTETTRKESESDAEFALRMGEAHQKVGELQGKVGELSGKMGEHAVAVGGATKAQREQRDALVAQIEQFQKATEIERATQAFAALDSALQSDTITLDDYLKRSQALNDITGLYTDEALKAATSQQTLISALTDPAGAQWYAQLQTNKAALDGVASATETVATKTRELTTKELRALGEESETAQGKTKTAAEEAVTALDKVSGEAKALAEEALPAVSKASEDISEKVNKLARDDVAELRTDTEIAASAMIAKFEEIADSIFKTSDRVVELRGKLEELPEVVNIEIRTTGIGSLSDIPGTSFPEFPGFQHGLDFTVPPGFPNDSAFLPLRVSSGERVIVQPRQEQAAGQAQVSIGGDTVIINDRLALAQYYEQKRMRLLERSASRMR